MIKWPEEWELKKGWVSGKTSAGALHGGRSARLLDERLHLLGASLASVITSLGGPLPYFGSWEHEEDGLRTKLCEFYAKHGHTPRKPLKSIPMEGWPGRNWASAQAYVYHKSGLSWHRWCCKSLELIPHGVWDVVGLKQKIREFYEQEGRAPHQSEVRPISGWGGKTWNAANQHLKSYASSSLPEMCWEVLGVYRKGEWDLEMLKEDIRTHFAKHGRPPPSTSSEPIEGRPGKTWGGARSYLVNSQGKSLLGFSMEVIGTWRGPWDLSRLREAVIAYHARHGVAPTKKSGGIDGWPGKTWVTSIVYLRKQGITFASFMTGILGVPQKGVWDYHGLADKVRDYYVVHGSYPQSKSSVEIDGWPGKTWGAADSLLRKQYDDTLWLFCDRVLDHAPNVRYVALRKPRKPEIREKIQAFYAEHGKRPSTIYGASPATIGRICRELGLPTLCKHERLDLDEVGKATRAYYMEHGHAPRTRSGPVEGMPGYTWEMLDHKLARQFKSTLNEYSCETLGIPKAWDLHALVEKVQEFVSTHARYPTTRSGTITGWPTKTWGQANAHLRHGGTNLAKFARKACLVAGAGAAA